jgi:hypothetical protein
MARVHSPFAFILRSLRADIRRIVSWFRPAPPLSWHVERTERRSGWDELVVGIIDDPELSMRLMSLRGQITMGTIDAVETAFDEVVDGAILHVDVTDAEFSDPLAFLHIERLVDQLEDRRVRIRMVGLNPTAIGPVD